MRLQVNLVFRDFALKVAVHLIFAVVVLCELVLPAFKFIKKHDVCLG